MNDLIIPGIILASVAFMFWYIQKRHWNARGEDDARREEE